jgi:predicted transcriptional regulator
MLIKIISMVFADELNLEYSGTRFDIMAAKEIGIDVEKKGNSITYIFCDGKITIYTD